MVHRKLRISAAGAAQEQSSKLGNHQHASRLHCKYVMAQAQHHEAQPASPSTLSHSSGTSCTRDAFASLTFAPLIKWGMQAEEDHDKVEHPSPEQLWKHPLATLSYLPKDAALFLAGAVAGVAAKTVTAPLDRIKLSMQVPIHCPPVCMHC